MAGEFYISGISGTGFDYQSYLAKYQELKMIPVNMLQADQTKLLAKQQALSAIKDKIEAFKDPIYSLSLNSTYETKKAVFSNPEVATATVTEDALETSYTLEVKQLAQANSFKVGTVNTITDTNAQITTSGALTINYLKDGVSTTFTVDYTNKTLNEIMNEINQSEDLQASIINLGSSSSPDYQLIITSKNTGLDNRILSIDDTSNPGDDTAGVFSEDTTKTFETIAAQDAEIVLNGITFTSSDNTFEDLITGVSLTVNDIGTTTLTIEKDNSQIEKALESIVNAYNELLDTVNAATDKDQPLAGEGSLNTMVSSIFRIISDGLGKYGLLDTVSDDAETTKGHIKINEEELNNFLDRSDAKDILQKFADTLENYINTYSDNVARMNQRYDDSIQDIDERIKSLTERVNKEIEMMRLKFARLEVYLSEMQSLQLRIQNFAAGLQTPDTNNA
ncbi:flagellar filament capping protein FliD [Persephonella sp. IF05-L8]|uniref:flagellar filament capping protein FliD n=1 Tax=Persephonella sp. IF05-L8 TaxID=1158338 RepID=UPI0004952679